MKKMFTCQNTVIVDNASYDYKDESNIGKSNLYNYRCNSTYSLFQAQHEMYDGVKINRNIVIIYDKGVIIHDSIQSKVSNWEMICKYKKTR